VSLDAHDRGGAGAMALVRDFTDTLKSKALPVKYVEKLYIWLEFIVASLRLVSPGAATDGVTYRVGQLK